MGALIYKVSGDAEDAKRLLADAKPGSTVHFNDWLLLACLLEEASLASLSISESSFGQRGSDGWSRSGLGGKASLAKMEEIQKEFP